MARGVYTETAAIRALRLLIEFAEDERASPLALARAGRAYVLPAAVEQLRSLTPPQVKELKQQLRDFLHAMAHAESASIAETTEHQFTVTLTTGKGERGIVLFVDGAPRDVLLYQVSTFLQVIGTDRLRRCPAPDCRRAFIKRGRREYCSDRCQRRAFLSRYDPFAAKARRKEKSTHGKTTR